MRDDSLPVDEDFEVLASGTPRRISRRVQLVVLGVLVLVAALGGIRWLTRGSPTVHITAYGQPVADPGGVLAAADQQFRAYAAAHHGALADNARCWFQRPPGSSDIGSDLLCGPVQFYDADPDTPYLRYELLAHGTGTPLRLTAASAPASTRLVAADDGTKLLRPGTAADPAASAGVAVPVAPPADPGAVVRTDIVHPSDLLRAPTTAVIGGDATTVQLASSGAVDDYGTGADERSAPAGKQLFAFRLDFDGGENSFAPPAALDLGVSVDSGPPRPLPVATAHAIYAEQFVVAAPPSAQLDLVLTELGITQRLSLRDGSTDPGNILFLQSKHQTRITAESTLATVRDRQGGTTHPGRMLVGLDYAKREFFVPGSAQHPRRTDHVFLYLYPFTDGSTSDQMYLGSADLIFTPTGGRPVRAASERFDVPVDVHSGTLTISGTVHYRDELVTFTHPLHLPVQLNPYDR